MASHSRGATPGEFPDYRTSVALKYVARGLEHLLKYVAPVAAAVAAISACGQLFRQYNHGDLEALVAMAKESKLQLDVIELLGCAVAVACAAMLLIVLSSRPVYLIDFEVYRPPLSWVATTTRFLVNNVNCGRFTPESLAFQEKIVARSGLGSGTHLPPAVLSQPPEPCMKHARSEFEDVMFTSVRNLLQRTGVDPKQIGIVVVNCSLFNPTPSLSAMIINHFKLRSDTISYNLSGMGCSASPIAIDMARQMLQLYPSTYALVCSTENITQNWYFGNERSMLVPNCLFRVGGAAMLLSNRRREGFRAKYQLLHTVRTNLAAREDAYRCIYQMEDTTGEVGVKLAKELMAVAGEGLKVNVTTLGPLVLPLAEQARFVVNLLLRKVLGKKLTPYIPNFRKAFDHVCIHTGGRAVVDEIEKQLRLGSDYAEPSRATLYRYGNVSSASIWYVLAYLETIRGVKRGDVVWQLAFGSGFKCNSAVWRSLRNNTAPHAAWADFDVAEMREFLAALPNHHSAAASSASPAPR